ncbi:hypothetical protein [Kitasatospora sp. MBT63]|uniref:hypothetical protein n=1 Tax=Kitasatospora sp. MBT63 TaxID=1444768 RepID=UPI0011EA6D9F|nr:hypothetical protein [Kitasatospora sp. MBT63]
MTHATPGLPNPGQPRSSQPDTMARQRTSDRPVLDVLDRARTAAADVGERLIGKAADNLG